MVVVVVDVRLPVDVESVELSGDVKSGVDVELSGDVYVGSLGSVSPQSSSWSLAVALSVAVELESPEGEVSDAVSLGSEASVQSSPDVVSVTGMPVSTSVGVVSVELELAASTD